MQVSASFIESKKNQLGLLWARLGIFVVVALFLTISAILQSQFISSEIYVGSYAALAIVFLDKVFLLSRKAEGNSYAQSIYFSLSLDAVALAYLHYLFLGNQSLFFFLGLVNILISGLIFFDFSLLSLVLISCLAFTVSQVFSPETKSLQYLFLLALNNLAFLLVGALSAFAASQLQVKTVLLQTVEELQNLVFSAMPLGLISINESGEIIQANDFARAFFKSGFSPETGENKIQNYLGSYNFTGAPFKRDFYLTVENEKKVLDVQAAPFVGAQENFWVLLFENVTHLRELESRTRQAEKMAAIGGLAAGIAHEIRNPLAGISGSIELLSQNTQTEEDGKLMRIILREISRLNNLITDFLDFAKPTQKPTELIDLSLVLSESVAQTKLAIQGKKPVEWEVDIPTKIQILGFPDRLKQVFLNLLINSCQAMETVEFAKMTVKVAPTAEGYRLVIQDTGSGMTEETRRRLFEPFYTTKSKGTGLGLAISHKIIESHEAKTVVESEVGKGTKFTIDFPK